MLNHFESLIVQAKQREPQRIVVVFPHHIDIIQAVIEAYHEGIINPILIGDKTVIKPLIEGYTFVIMHETDPIIASKKAMMLVNHHDVDIIMKGLIDTHHLLKAVVNDTYGIKKADVLSHVGLLAYDDFDRILYVSDGAMNIAPNVTEKIAIIENAVSLVYKIEQKRPKVGLVSAVEKVNKKMISTVDAQEILNYYKNKDITFDIDGPFAIDNLVSLSAVEHKGLKGPVAGQANILIFPNIESGNVFYKTSVFLAHATSAGIVMGAKVPIVLTSRADSKEAKLNSIYLAVVVS